MHQNNVKLTASVELAGTSIKLLLVEDADADAALVERALKREIPGVDVRRARTFGEARRQLATSLFDVALVEHELPDGDCFDLLNYLVASSIALPVVVLAEYGHESIALTAMKTGAGDCVRKELDHRHLEILPTRVQEAIDRHVLLRQSAERARRLEHRKVIEKLRTTVASVKHEINNPLAIVSGNAQLLLELARMMELDEELVKPIRDIEEASLRIAESLDKLNNIKELIAGEYLNGKDGANSLSHGR